MSLHNQEIRPLTRDEMDAISGGMLISLWKGFGVDVKMTVSSHGTVCVGAFPPGGGNTGQGGCQGIVPS
jgi:hypothetical protein